MDMSLAGEWIAEAPGNAAVHGYHLSRLYAPWLNLPALIRASEEITPAGQREFHNSDLGLPFVPPGGGASVDTLDRCRGDYALEDYAGQPCVMGVDVGLKLHVVIRQYHDPWYGDNEHPDPPASLWFADTVDRFDELTALAKRFHVRQTVIDAQPETRAAIAHALRDEAEESWISYYSHSLEEPEYTSGDGVVPNQVHANRTLALDAVYDRFRDGTAQLPRDARQLGGRVREGYGEYYREVLVPTRSYEDDAHGNPTARWSKDGDDHYPHAEVYCYLAGRAPSGSGVW